MKHTLVLTREEEGVMGEGGSLSLGGKGGVSASYWKGRMKAVFLQQGDKVFLQMGAFSGCV